MRKIALNKKYVVMIVTLFLLVIFIITSILILLSPKGVIESENKVDNEENYTRGLNIASSPTLKPISYTVVSNSIKPLAPLIEYTHSSGVYGFSYPSDWEFLPERAEMGLRPLEYKCSWECFNEVVTVLYFKGKGSNYREFANEFSGVYDWVDTTINGNKGIYYDFGGINIAYSTYWFSNGTDAVNIIFSRSTKFPSDGNFDNSKYENDFKAILNSFNFKI